MNIEKLVLEVVKVDLTLIMFSLVGWYFYSKLDDRIKSLEDKENK